MKCSQFYFEHFHISMRIISQFPDFLFETIIFFFKSCSLNISTDNSSFQLLSQIIIISFQSFDQTHHMFILIFKQFSQLISASLTILTKLRNKFIEFTSDIFIFLSLLCQFLFIPSLNSISFVL